MLQKASLCRLCPRALGQEATQEAFEIHLQNYQFLIL